MYPEKHSRRRALAKTDVRCEELNSLVPSDDERGSGDGGGLVGKKVKYTTLIIDPNSARADRDSRGLWRSRTVLL